MQNVLKAVKSKLRNSIFRLTPNLIIDNVLKIKAQPFEQLNSLTSAKIVKMYFSMEHLKEFLSTTYPDWNYDFSDIRHKKLIQLFISFSLLHLKESDTYMDVAGGLYSYAFYAKCKKRYLHDQKLKGDLKKRAADYGVLILESTASSIPLPDESIDKISCHHSFEHFKGDADLQFINEVQRLLKPGGLCCVLPIFISERYFEIVDGLQWKKSDTEAKLVFDHTSPFPGGSFSGGFARIYDLKKFQERVVNNIDQNLYEIKLIEVCLNGKPVPNIQLKCNEMTPMINCPYRALLIHKYNN